MGNLDSEGALQVQHPAWSSTALKVGSDCSGPPPVQFENLPRWSSAVTACPKAQSLWDFFLVLLLLIVTVVLLLYILEKLYSPLDEWISRMDILNISCFDSSCLLPLAGWVSLAPSPFLKFWMLLPHSGLTGLSPVLWHLGQFVNTFFFVLGSPEVPLVLLVWFPICLIKSKISFGTPLLLWPSIKLAWIIASSHHWPISSLPYRMQRSFLLSIFPFFFLSIAKLPTSIGIQQALELSQGQDIVPFLGKLYEDFLAHFSKMSKSSSEWSSYPLVW